MIGPLAVLKDVTQRLESAGIEYFLVGSLAAMYYGRPRFTNDIDLVVHIKADQLLSFENLFPLSDFYCPPSEVLRDEVIRMGSFNLIHHVSGIKIDIVLLKNSEFYISEFSRRKKVKLAPDLAAFIGSPEDIIIKKLDYFREGGSEKHLLDIREILMTTQIDREYLSKWINYFGLRSQWEKV